MASYTNEFSTFPDSIDTKTTFSDITNSDLTLLNRYNTFINNNDISSAKSFLAANPTLAAKVVTTEYINKVFEALRNMEIYAKTAKQSIYVQSTTPDGAIDDDVWID